MAEFNSYLLGKARKSVGNLTIVYAKGKISYVRKYLTAGTILHRRYWCSG